MSRRALFVKNKKGSLSYFSRLLRRFVWMVSWRGSGAVFQNVCSIRFRLEDSRSHGNAAQRPIGGEGRAVVEDRWAYVDLFDANVSKARELQTTIPPLHLRGIEAQIFGWRR